MPVESEGPRDSEAFDEEFAGAVGKAPVLVGKPLEYLPRSHHIGFAEMMHARDLPRKEPPPQSHRAAALTTHPEQRQRFIHHVVAGEDRITVAIKLGDRGLVVRIGRHDQGKPRAGIDEDHGTLRGSP